MIQFRRKVYVGYGACDVAVSEFVPSSRVQCRTPTDTQRTPPTPEQQRGAALHRHPQLFVGGTGAGQAGECKANCDLDQSTRRFNSELQQDGTSRFLMKPRLWRRCSLLSPRLRYDREHRPRGLGAEQYRAGNPPAEQRNPRR
jgi:hypothetical protein